MEVIVADYDPQWPWRFSNIKAELSGDLVDAGVPFKSIDHIGSTSIPDLPAKPIIDVLITVESSDFNEINLENFKEALSWGTRQGGYHYIGSGGVQGRWSFKLHGDVDMRRNVYVMPDDGGLILRSYTALKMTLMVDEELRKEYGRIKIELSEKEYGNIMQYAARKRPIIRRILKKAGWYVLVESPFRQPPGRPTRRGDIHESID